MAIHQLKTVVIADDDNQIRNSLKEFFKGTMYQVVAEAPNGLEIVEKCKEYTPDIAIIDIQMPIMDGIKVTEIISQEKTAKCIIMLTSFDDKEYIDRAIMAGASGYLTKPVEFGLIIPTIEVCLAKSKDCYLLNKDIQKMKKRRDTRDVIDKAKLVVMENKNVSEDKAYEIIRELSRRKQISMEHVAHYLLVGQRRSNERY
ncbi:ANTAR domain-containing response regulator [Aminipila terrae]|uniref:Stage 0 sporulation protein A homolog n=1 Tax=Aminipila terrae TaxID=2697030 RepID=A0A6P1MB24_9FIRM|nr:response regulator [Aminipila terrae]QHI71127.1 response regulator [Aminipila terrae]